MECLRCRNSERGGNVTPEESEYNELVHMRRYYTCSAVIMITTAILVIVICVCSTESRQHDPVAYPTSSNCPQDTTPCDTADLCINRTKMCDGEVDCPDQSDEGLHCDDDQFKYFDNMFEKRQDHERSHESSECILPKVPPPCECKSKTHLYCNEKGLHSVPKHLPSRVTELDLSDNNISSVTASDFKKLTDLRMLLFQRSSLKFISNEAFRSCMNLSTVNLNGNNLQTFSSSIFSRNNTIETLVLTNNHLMVIRKHDFQYLDGMKKLNLAYNEISLIEPGAFSKTAQLCELDISWNKLSEIKTSTFNQLLNVWKLVLLENEIELIEPGSFNEMKKLTTLSLSRNKLTSIDADMFRGLDTLLMLDLSENMIQGITHDAFDPVPTLKSLILTDNPFRRIPKETFHRSKNLEFIYFDKFYMCAYVQDMVEVCEPHGDGISSHENLLENLLLRISVWIVAILACAGNIVVLLGRFMLKEDNQTHSFFIKNLSLSDMIMGVYLFVIGSRDIMYRGDYMFHDEEWRNSWECDLCGILSTVSSEMSVMTLTLITFDRYMSIMYPLSFRKRGLKVAYLAMGSLWMLAILLGIFPVLKLDYFGDSFYRDNAVCIPLHLHDPFVEGWEYSAVLILGVNSVSFAFITYAYVAMFFSIQRTAMPLRTTRESRDHCLVKRFFFIVITDFACWVPIIVIKILALSGVKISGDLYAWVVVFVLPVNSALNPLLYSITTKLFKQKLMSKFSSVVWRPHTNKDSTHSGTNAKANKATVASRNALNTVELQCLRKHRQRNTELPGNITKPILKNTAVKKSEFEDLSPDLNIECAKADSFE